MMHNAKLFMLNYDHIDHVFLLLLVCQSQIIWSQRKFNILLRNLMTPREIIEVTNLKSHYMDSSLV